VAAPRVYHWKHGWIPLDHYAALSKAKGREAGARKYLARSHAAGVAHESVVRGEYGGGTHERGSQPVSAGHLPRGRHITAAFNPETRRFGLHDAKAGTTTAIPEHLAEHINGRGYRIRAVEHAGDHHRLHVETRAGERKTFRADGSDKAAQEGPDLSRHSDGALDRELEKAFETGDQDHIDRVMVEMDRREASRKQFAEQLKSEAAAAHATAKPKQNRVDLELRADYEAYVHSEWLKAEGETNGVLLNRAGRAAGVDPRSLWEGNAATARKYASEELKTYWQRNGRLTRGAFASHALGRRSDRAARQSSQKEGWYDSAA
jgi:molybdopterin-guanine dinucleotide biosynthesis protein